MNYLWDTNILVHYTRNSDRYKAWESQYDFFNGNNRLFFSIINIGEIESLAYQLNWGAMRRQRLQEIIENIQLKSLEFHV